MTLTSHSNRATNAEYRVEYLGENGQSSEMAVRVNQTAGGGQWQELGVFIPRSPQASVLLSNDADGYVIAEAIKLQVEPENIVETVRIELASKPAYVIDGLTEGEWLFQIRAIDTSGQASDFSEPKIAIIE